MDIERRTLELFLGLIFVALLMVACVIVLTQDQKSASSSVSNSYNVNSYNDYSKEIPASSSVVYKQTFPVVYKRFYENLDYSSYGRHLREKDWIGTYVDEFYVYVINKEDFGRDFKVKFYFEDSRGNEFSETVTHYVRAGEKKKFYFKDVQEERYKYDSWSYKVFPEDSKLIREYEVSVPETVIYRYKSCDC